MTLIVDGKRIPNCKDVEIRLYKPPTKAKMLAFWVRETDGIKCRTSAGNVIKILETEKGER